MTGLRDDVRLGLTWSELAPGGELTATVLMASGFVLDEDQRVRERYHVDRTIGEGAMGQVLAVTLVGGADQQTYALKVVARPADANRDGVLDAAEREAADEQAKAFAGILRQEAAKQDMAQRHGVSVARLFALVQLDDGSIGMRMELARGTSLVDRVEIERPVAHRAPDVLASVMIVRKLLSQLRRLHELSDPGSAFGFIHSDVKPGNVFVDDGDASDLQITLLDFGVATAGQAMVHDLETSGGGDRKTFILQQTGGTLGYAPPYHFTGKATPLSDVYASIVILYELITLELPWTFGDLTQSPDNILALESAMLAGPRPVREVRPSIPEDDARALDEFFVREFSALHRLAEGASQALSIPDEDVRRTMTERLTRLARDYQGTLEALRHRFAVARTSTVDDPYARISGPADRSSGPSIPRPSRLPAIDQGVPGLEVVSLPPGPMRESLPIAPAASLRPPPAPAASRVPWLIAVLAVPMAAGGTWWYLRGRVDPLEDRGVSVPMVSAVPPKPTARVAAPVAPALSAAVPRIVRTMPPPPASVTLDALRDAPLGPAPVGSNRVHPSAAPMPSGALQCACLAGERGARVVAHGGALGRDVVVCQTTDPLADGRTEFLGRGSIPADVLGAMPSFACHGADDTTTQLTVQRFSSATGSELLLRCHTAGVPNVVRPATASAPGGSAGGSGATRASAIPRDENRAVDVPGSAAPDREQVP